MFISMFRDSASKQAKGKHKGRHNSLEFIMDASSQCRLDISLTKVIIAGICEKFNDIFDERNPEYSGMYISRVIGREVNSKLEKKINGRLLYLRGFYDFIVDKYGQEETDRLILSARVPEDTKKLMDAAEEYGVVEKNSTTMKEFLRQFVEK